MKARTIITLLALAAFLFVGSELGVIQRAFDSRSIVEDGVVGSGFWIVAVDGRPTQRIQHGLFITKVPFALLEPGERVMQLSATSRPTNDDEVIEFRTLIKEGVNYQLSKSDEGTPEIHSAK